ncbi:MAG: hypothetical protein J7M39_14680 [Anaerolineae bacterium]|nr:hypothetical protein [Anaerolineae bacterium]
MPNLIYGLLALTVLCAAIVALLARSLIRSVIALGMGSASLAMLLFLLNAPYAAGFELSVGAGLISILLIIGISLTKARRPHSP